MKHGRHRSAYKLVTSRKLRRNFFGQRVVQQWNKLPENVANATETVNTSKNRVENEIETVGQPKFFLSSMPDEHGKSVYIRSDIR